ncbi:MAG TPA: 5-oxoprolinase subunit PxpB [Gemmatimonadaceae bacterium]
MRPPVRFAPLGDRALVLRLGERADEPTFDRVRSCAARLAGAHRAILDVVPAYTTVTVHYDPSRVESTSEPPHRALAAALEPLIHDDAHPPLIARTVEIPVCYEGDLAPDLDEVARHTGLDAQEVIALHSGATYVVRMIGFLPGFPYLAGLDPRLATPRRAEPRTRVAAGSVGIGGEQTGIYPVTSPGGWRLIGRTPLALFDARREPGALLAVGDTLRFHAISRTDYDRMSAR